MSKRYEVDMQIPRGSADGQLVVVDLQSDNDVVLVLVDPQEMLTEENRRALAERIADALNSSHPAHVFEPEYES